MGETRQLKRSSSRAHPLSSAPAKRKKDSLAEQKSMIYDCYNAALDKMAEEIAVLDLRGVSSVADFFVICHGGSARQVQAIAENVEMAFRKHGIKYYNVEGKKACSWVLLDFHDIVVHVFHGATRGFYALESLWADAKKLEADEILAWG